MSINFEKNRQKITIAWKNVLDSKSLTNWALFGYEGQTNDLKLVGTGENGLEELCEELNSAKIMYAFLRICDSHTGLIKFVLINWQGEGAPLLRKGTCANHIHDVTKFFKGAHLTINARVEDDIDKDRILQKLNTAAISFDLKDSKVKHDEPRVPVGTNYNRVIPAKELNPTEMQNFWKKEKKEEWQRIELEKEMKRQEIIKREEEQRLREEKEYREREQSILVNTDVQSAYIPIKTSPQPLSPNKTLHSPTRLISEVDKMRQQRSQEVLKIIGTRVGNAKAIFTQNTSNDQSQTKIAPAKPIRNSIAQKINAFNSTQSNDNDKTIINNVKIPETTSTEIITKYKKTSNEANEINNIESDIKNKVTFVGQSEDNFTNNEEQYSTIKRSPHNKTNPVDTPDDEQIAKNTNELLNNSNQSDHIIDINDFSSLQGNDISDDDIIYQDMLSDGGLKARALYDYQAADESEITFDPGDIITHIDQIDEGWWQGLGPDGTYGLFPANYVEII